MRPAFYYVVIMDAGMCGEWGKYAFGERNNLHTPEHGGGSQMFYVCFSLRVLHDVEGRMKTAQYQI